MKNIPIVFIICAIIIATAYFLGRHRGSNSDVDRRLLEAQTEIERIGASRDSIEALRTLSADSLAVFARRIESADSARARAEDRVRSAFEIIDNMTTYENLSHDDLARRADSLFRASTDG